MAWQRVCVTVLFLLNGADCVAYFPSLCLRIDTLPIICDKQLNRMTMFSGRDNKIIRILKFSIIFRHNTLQFQDHLPQQEAFLFWNAG